jgi:hypothetical protein
MADVLKVTSMVIAESRVDALYHQHSEWTVPHSALSVLVTMLIKVRYGSASMESVVALGQRGITIALQTAIPVGCVFEVHLKC